MLSTFTDANVVGPDSGPLTTIDSQDPMMTSKSFIESLAIRIEFSDGTFYNEVGKLNFVNATVDQPLIRSPFERRFKIRKIG